MAQGLSEADLVRFCSEIFPDEQTYQLLVNEARFGLSRVLPVFSSLDRDRPDVLEVGAGSCILSAYLASKNVRVTALEPLGPEFGFFSGVLQGDVERDDDTRVDLVWPGGARVGLEHQPGASPGIDRLEIEGLAEPRTMLGTRFVPV